MKERKRSIFSVRRILSAVFAVSFAVSLLGTFSAFAGANLFKIQDAKLSDLSANVSGTISSFDESTIVSNVTFHKLNDSAKYTITLKNTDSKDHIIESISDDNENPYINYLYDSYANTLVKAGDSFDFVVTAKYTNAVTDMNARAQATNVKFIIKYTDVPEPEVISINPSTGDEIVKNVIILAISATGLIICMAIALKRNKKLNKVTAIAIAAVAAATIATSVKAATVEVNSFTLTTNYGFYDKVVIIYTDKNGDEQELISNYNEPANIPDQSKDGYTLTGWEDEQGDPVDPTQPITEDIKIHPVYRAHTYTIRFNGNGATSGEMTDLAMTFDEAKTLPVNAFNFPGRTYTGWDTEANGSGAHYGDQAEAKNLTTEDGVIVTLYAQWSVNPFFINYDGNGATSGEMATTNCDYDQSCILRDNAFSKPGYHFTGWKYNNNDYANKADVKNIIESGTITMVAQWAVNHYTIVFDINTDDSNASGDMADMANLEYGQDYTLTANAFTRTGYNFGGWNTEIDGRNFGLTDEQEFHNLTTTNNAVIMLYAQWNPIHYNIVFHQNHDDATGNTNSMTNIAYDDTRILTQNGFELAHYKFMGWNTAEDGTGTPYEDKASIKNLTATDGATIDLYAQWKERTAMLQTGPNVKSALSNLNNTATTFKRYDDASAPDLDSISDKVDIALPTSSFPVWAWSEDDNVYWWSEAEAPKFNPASNNFFNGLSFTSIDVSGLNASSATNMNGMFANLRLTSLNLSGFDSSAAKNMGSMFSGTTISSLDLSSLNTSSATTMGSMFYKAKIDSLKLYDETNPSESLFKTDNVTEMAGMFRESNIPSIDASKFNTAKVKDFSGMFMSASATTIDVSGWNTESATDFTNTFANVKITSLDLSHFNTKKVKSMLGMFDGTVKMENLNVSGWDNESLTTVGYMFRSCGSNVTNGATINLAGFTTSKVKSMNLMFSGSGFTSLNLGSFSSAELTDMSNMFSQMGKIQSLSFGPDFTAEHVTNMNFAFAQMGRSMVNLDLSSLNVSSVTNLNGAFASNNAVTIDLTGWDFSNVESANNAFYGANYIATIYASSDFPASLGGTSFAYGQPIKGGAGTTYIGNENAYARIDDPDSGNPGYFTLKNARYIRYNGNGADNATPYGAMTSEYLKAGDKLKENAFTRRGFKFAGWKDADGNEYTDEQVMADLVESKTPLELFAQWSEITATLNTGANVNNALKAIAGDATSFEMYTAGTPDFGTIDGERVISANNSAAKVYVWNDAEAGKIYWWSEAYQSKFNANSASMFAGLTKLTNIDLTDLNASTATNLSNLYKGDTALVSTNITAQDTSNVTNMNSMFMNTGFTELSLEGLETNNVTDMANMFNGVKKIMTLDTTPLNTEKVTTMSAMFANTTALDSINLTDFDTSSVTNMSSMFSASSISSVNLASFDTTNVTDISSMFKNTANLATVDLSPLEVQSVTTMASLFEGSGITSIDVAPLATESVMDMSAMFKNTLGLTELNVAPLNTTNVTTMKDMFYGSYHLASLDVSMLNTANVQNMSGTFGILGRETVLKMYDTPETTKFTTSNVTDMSYMFRGDRELNQGLVNIDLSHIDTSKVTNMSGMFQASRARSLDFSHFDTRKVTNMSQMFFIAPYLSRIDLSAFETPELKNVNQMFYYDGGTGASVIDMRNFDFSKANLANLAPYGPWGGKTYYMGKFDLSSTTANTEINLGSNGTQKIYVNTEYDPSIALERNIRVRQAANGMNGTVANNTTRTYAEYQRIDDPAHDAPGFFWIENPLAVNFDAQGGAASRTKYNYIPGTDYGTLPTVTTSPEGKIFAGWYTAAEGGEKIENSAAFISNETHTLYAHWEEAGFGGTIDLERQYSSIDVLQTSNTMPQGYVGAAYFNPADLSQTCTATSENVADKTAKSGCMKWYIYGEDGDNYKMILDHSTTTNISFNNISSTLASDTAGWDNESLTVGILSAEDVAAIANLSSFDINVTDSYLYLNEHETHTQGNSPYVWLYDYTENCVALGCDNETSSGFGFWTTSGVHGKNNEAWLINYMGRLTTAQKSLNNWGIRPIITVPKETVNAE